jgi:hypothetical protein
MAIEKLLLDNETSPQIAEVFLDRMPGNKNTIRLGVRISGEKYPFYPIMLQLTNEGEIYFMRY